MSANIRSTNQECRQDCGKGHRQGFGRDRSGDVIRCRHGEVWIYGDQRGYFRRLRRHWWNQRTYDRAVRALGATP